MHTWCYKRNCNFLQVTLLNVNGVYSNLWRCNLHNTFDYTVTVTVVQELEAGHQWSEKHTVAALEIEIANKM